MELDWWQYSHVVAQATGMVSVQANCSLDDAGKLIRQQARSTESTVEDVAASVVEQRLRIEAHA